MKKWAILAVVIVLAVIYGLQVATRGSKTAPALIPVPQEPQGISLPQDTTQYYPASDYSYKTSSVYGPLPTGGNPAHDKELCPGVSFNSILSQHGRIWGYTAKSTAFPSNETSAIYGLVSQYLACSGLARRDPSTCDSLPGEGDSVEYFASPNYACRAEYTDIAFADFMAGGEKADTACGMFMSGDIVKNGPQLQKSDFCTAASKGLENVCSGIERVLPAGFNSKCLSIFPKADPDCGGDKDCLNRRATYLAMKAGKASACPKKSVSLCEAYIKKSAAPCAEVLNRVGVTYCGYLSKLQKQTGGAAGFTPEQAKEMRLAAVKKKAEEEAILKEKKKLEEDVNKRVRGLLQNK